MSPERLTEYLNAQIPLSLAMGVRVVAASRDEVLLSAPLAPNLNHKRTMFGGSGASVLTLAAWTLLTVRLSDFDPRYEVVIADGSTSFLRPVEDDFLAIASAGQIDWSTFEASLRRKERGRIQLRSTLCCRGVECASFVGQFVATREALSRTEERWEA